MEKRRKAQKRFSALTSFLLALALLAGTLGALPAECFAAQPEKAAFHSTYGFRLGSSAKMELQFRDKLEKNYKVNGNTYYGSQTDLSRQLRDQMVKRSDQVVLRLATDRRGLTGRSNSAAQAREELFLGLLNDATAQRNSVSARDGDYLRWQLGSVSGVLYADGNKNGIYYYRVIYYGLGYYTTAAEEQWVDRYVQNYVRRVDRNKMSDYDLAKKVHDDVCRATVYDMEMDSRYDDYDFSAYGCLYVGRCVCQGYALAYYRLCRELGLSVRFVYSDPHEGCHAWNLVQVGGKYYYVDCTWDDTYHEGNIVYNFFLKNYADLQAMDSDYHEHRLDDGVYADADLTRNYVDRVAARSYEPLLPNMGNVVVRLSQTQFTYNGKAQGPKLTVTYAGQPFSGYTVRGGTATNPGTYTVTLRGTGGDSTRRTYTIRPAKVQQIKITKREPKALTFSWQKAVGASTYRLQQKKNGKWVTVKTVNGNSAKIGGLSPAATYTFRVTAYKGGIAGANGSNYVTCTTPLTPAAPKLTAGKGTVTVKWKKVTASGYEVRYSTRSDMKKAKTVKIGSGKTVQKKLSKLSRHKKYYVQVRAVKTRKNADGKTVTYRGAWSGKKSISTK